jgi:hypothetical protein
LNPGPNGLKVSSEPVDSAQNPANLDSYAAPGAAPMSVVPACPELGRVIATWAGCLRPFARPLLRSYARLPVLSNSDRHAIAIEMAETAVSLPLFVNTSTTRLKCQIKLRKAPLGPVAKHSVHALAARARPSTRASQACWCPWPPAGAQGAVRHLSRVTPPARLRPRRGRSRPRCPRPAHPRFATFGSDKCNNRKIFAWNDSG